MVTPQITIRITNDPVFQLSLGISAPADDGDGVIELLPLDTAIHHSLVRDFNVFLGKLLLLVVTQLSKLDNSFMQGCDALLSDNTIFVKACNSWELDLTIDSTAMDDFLHDSFLSGGTVALADILGVGDFDIGLA